MLSVTCSEHLQTCKEGHKPHLMGQATRWEQKRENILALFFFCLFFLPQFVHKRRLESCFLQIKRKIMFQASHTRTNDFLPSWPIIPNNDCSVFSTTKRWRIDFCLYRLWSFEQGWELLLGGKARHCMNGSWNWAVADARLRIITVNYPQNEIINFLHTREKQAGKRSKWEGLPPWWEMLQQQHLQGEEQWQHHPSVMCPSRHRGQLLVLVTNPYRFV